MDLHPLPILLRIVHSLPIPYLFVYLQRQERDKRIGRGYAGNGIHTMSMLCRRIDRVEIGKGEVVWQFIEYGLYGIINTEPGFEDMSIE